MKKKLAVLTILFFSLFLLISACDFLEEALSDGEDLVPEIQELSANEDYYSYSSTSKFQACSIINKGVATSLLNLLFDNIGTGVAVDNCSTEELVGKCVWGDEKPIYSYFYKGDNYIPGVTNIGYKSACEILTGKWTNHKD